MTLYRPLLKAKPGEWQAFGALPPAVAGGIRPVFEIGPDADVVKAVANPTAKATRYLPAGSIVDVDCGFLVDPHRRRDGRVGGGGCLWTTRGSLGTRDHFRDHQP